MRAQGATGTPDMDPQSLQMPPAAVPATGAQIGVPGKALRRPRRLRTPAAAAALAAGGRAAALGCSAAPTAAAAVGPEDNRCFHWPQCLQPTAADIGQWQVQIGKFVEAAARLGSTPWPEPAPQVLGLGAVRGWALEQGLGVESVQALVAALVGAFQVVAACRGQSRQGPSVQSQPNLESAPGTC